tara:strand:- start:124 stop:411 length:288 start_codon:yes stop_codon:yes gene_type:complete
MSNKYFQSKQISKGQLEWSIKQTKSMTKASQLLDCSYNTFKKYCKIHGLWNPNQCGRGIKKPKKSRWTFSDPMMFHRSSDEINDSKQKILDSLQR